MVSILLFAISASSLNSAPVVSPADLGSPYVVANWMQESQLSQPYTQLRERGVYFQMGQLILTGFPYYPSQHREENGMGLTDELPKSAPISSVGINEEG